MKALILNFAAFDSNKDPKNPKSYFRFDMYDTEGKALYNIFTEQRFLPTPGGEIPREDEFPRTAELRFRIEQYRTREGKTAFAPRVDEILSWKSVDLKKL